MLHDSWEVFLHWTELLYFLTCQWILWLGNATDLKIQHKILFKKQFQQMSEIMFVSLQWNRASYTDTPSNSLSKQATVFCDCCTDVYVPSSLHFPAYFLLLSCSNSWAWANQLNKFSHYRDNKSTIVRGFFSLSILPGCSKQNIICYNLALGNISTFFCFNPPLPHAQHSLKISNKKQTKKEKHQQTTKFQEAITEPCTGAVSNARLKSHSRHWQIYSGP